jgi:hypothetical protein
MLEALILWRLGSVDRALRGLATEGLEEGEYDGLVAVLVLPAFVLSLLLWPVGLAILLGLRLPRTASLVVAAFAGLVALATGSPEVWAVAGLSVTFGLFTLLRRLDNGEEIQYTSGARTSDDTTEEART